MRLSWLFTVVLAASTGASACGGASTSSASSGPGSGNHGLASSDPAPAHDATCPLEVPGTSVTVEDSTDGAALVFVTTGSADEVRTRAKALADAHNGHSASPSSLAGMLAVDANATASDVTGGARVAFAAAGPEGAPKIQSELRMHAQHLSAGTCKMAM